MNKAKSAPERRRHVVRINNWLRNSMTGKVYKSGAGYVLVVNNYKDYAEGRCIYFRLNQELTGLGDPEVSNGSFDTHDFRLEVVPTSKRKESEGGLVETVLRLIAEYHKQLEAE